MFTLQSGLWWWSTLGLSLNYIRKDSRFLNGVLLGLEWNRRLRWLHSLGNLERGSLCKSPKSLARILNWTMCIAKIWIRAKCPFLTPEAWKCRWILWYSSTILPINFLINQSISCFCRFFLRFCLPRWKLLLYHFCIKTLVILRYNRGKSKVSIQVEYKWKILLIWHRGFWVDIRRIRHWSMIP